MSEEIELRRRLEQAEAFARTLQSQRDAAEQNAADLRAALNTAMTELDLTRRALHNAWLLIGRCDYFLQYGGPKAQAAQLRAEIKKASGQ